MRLASRAARRHLIAAEARHSLPPQPQGLPVSQAAQEHGLSTKTIYGWISRGVTSSPSVLELAKLKRENQALKELIGELTLEMSLAKKKEHDR